MQSEWLDFIPGPIAPEFQQAHRLVADFLPERLEAYRLESSSINCGASFKEMVAREPAELVNIVRAAIDRAYWQEREMHRAGSNASYSGLNYLPKNGSAAFRISTGTPAPDSCCAENLRDPKTGTQARAAAQRELAEQLEFTARTGA